MCEGPTDRRTNTPSYDDATGKESVRLSNRLSEQESHEVENSSQTVPRIWIFYITCFA